MGNELGDGTPGSVLAGNNAELLLLAARLASCRARVEEVLAGLRDVQLVEWQSPAGQAYRDTAARQATALRRALDILEEARAAVARHAQESPPPVAMASGWP